MKMIDNQACSAENGFSWTLELPNQSCQNLGYEESFPNINQDSSFQFSFQLASSLVTAPLACCSKTLGVFASNNETIRNGLAVTETSGTRYQVIAATENKPKSRIAASVTVGRNDGSPFSLCLLTIGIATRIEYSQGCNFMLSFTTRFY